ncbi:MAG: hypothetical protein ACOCR8_04510, partial [Desulfosalsimonas sp.]
MIKDRRERNPAWKKGTAICSMLLCFIFCMLSTSAAASQREPVKEDDLVVTATKTEKAIKDAP